MLRLADFILGPARGAAMLLTRSPFDLETLGRNVFEEFWVAHPQGPLHFHADGDLTGDWDAARLRQVISNLLGNALQQGTAQGPGELAISGRKNSTIVLKVHNGGAAAPGGEADYNF